MRFRRPALRAALAVTLLLVPVLAFGQAETGRVSGTVYDQTGAVLPGATVTLVSTATGAIRTTVSDSAGRYVIANLPPGPFEIRTELSGFSTQTAKLVVNVGATVTVETRLQLAGTTEAVTVVAESPVINTANAELATTIRQEQIRDLPTLTRNPYDLVAVAGNSVTDTQSGRGTGYAINGMRSASTNVLLDGSANNDEFTATVGQEVPLDAVAEFSVITSNFSAQYGRAIGGVVNVATKAGTNTFHGTAYDFYRDETLAANSYDNTSNGIEKGKFTRHQMGYSFGGPVVHDKLHFFSSLEYIRVRSNDTQISWVPTQQFLAASAPATQSFFNAYGSGVTRTGTVLTRGDVSALIGTSSGAFSQLPADLPVFARVEKALAIDAGGGQPQDNYQFIGRADYSMSPQNQVYVRYAYQSDVRPAGTNASSPYDGFDTGSDRKNHSLLGSYTHVYSPTMTSQTKLVWNRLYNFQPLNGEPGPTLYMNPTTAVRLQGYRIAFPGYLPWSPGSAIPFGGPQKFLQLYHDQTWIKGRHDIRFGGSYAHIWDDRTFGAYENSVESLNTTSNALVSLDSFVLGQIRRFQAAINPQGYPGGTYVTPVGFPSFTSYNRYNEFALYVNDNWSIRNRVTLNLGLRYEYYGPQTKSEPKYDSNFYYADVNASVNSSSPQEIIDSIRGGRVYPTNESPIGALWKSDWNNFAPRIGVAWDVRGNGKTSVRGGYGMSYERNFGNVTYNVLFNPPEYLVASIDAPTDVPTMPIFTDNQGPFGGVAGVTKTIPAGSLRHIDQNIVTAYGHFWAASFQHELFPGTTVSVEYSGSKGLNLYDLADPNKRGAALVYEGIGTAGQRPNTQYAAFNTRGNRGESRYDGVTFSYDARRVSDTGLMFSARYTLSKAKDNLSSTFSDSSANYNLGYLDAFDPMLDWGYAEFDVRHRFVFSAIWELPFFRNASGLTQTLGGGWQLNWIFEARTGFPFTLWDCTNGLGYCMRAEDPLGIDKNATSGVSTGNPNEFRLIDLTSLLPYAGGYVNPITGNSDFGPYPADMTARDAFRGPGYWNIDFALMKRFRFGSRYAIQFRAEAYNLLNHPNLYARADAADISSVSEITGYKDDYRRCQLALKFEF